MKEYIVTMGEGNIRLPFRVGLAGITYKDPDYRVVRKKSNISVIEYIIDGEGTVICNGKRFSVKAGDVYLLLPGEDCDYFSDAKNPWQKIWFNIDGDLPKELARLYHLEGRTHFPNMDCFVYFKKMLVACEDKGRTNDEKNRSCAVVFHEILSFLSARTNTAEQISEEGGRLKNYLDVHIREPVRLSQLAELIHRSESQMIRIFKNDYGMTPYDYLLNSRIHSAKRMLEETNLLVKEITFQLGFSDEHYFSDLFKRKTGCSPVNYRKKMK